MERLNAKQHQNREEGEERRGRIWSIIDTPGQKPNNQRMDDLSRRMVEKWKRGIMYWHAEE